MTQQNQTPNPQIDHDDPDLSLKLKKRLLIAGGLVAIALAAIPVMDSLNKPKVEMTATNQTSSSGKIQQQAASSTASVPAPIAQTAIETSAPQNESSAPSNINNTLPSPPPLPTAAKTESAITQQQAAPPPLATTTKPKAPQSHDRTVEKKELSQTPASKPTKPNQAPQIATQEAKSNNIAMPTTKDSQAKPSGSSVGYQVQLGLFASVSNAEKLLQELKKQGIQAHSVTKVQLGPFKTRAEADEAMNKLRQLGYTPLLSPAGQ
ncbi:SPOR domain-containing protein [Neisseriaceae bacterium TC5R-5]|nr:SPOR domain-containing protein [Neisseriaceae bacterium TC5R-5]